MLKWTLIAAGGLLALLIVVLSAAGFLFANWRSEAIAAREDDPARTIAQTAQGPVEYAVAGEGLPVLSIHGTPGGYDQALAVQRALPERARPGTMTIAASRPGYLGTPLNSGASFGEQADLHAALLDELGIERVVVFGASGGGPVALQFALRHPERTLGLLLYAPEVKALPEGTPDPRNSERMPGWRMTLLEMGMWLVGGPLASSVVNEFDPDDQGQVKSLAAMMKTVVPWSEHLAGQENDIVQRLDPAMNEWPVEKIAAPTLIMHGDADANAPYENSREIAARIPNAEFVTFEGGDHFVMISRWREVSARMQRFLDRFRDSAIEAQANLP